MKKTVKPILGAAVALAMAATGAFAEPVIIDQLPYSITTEGDYVLALAPDAPPIPANFSFAISITASNVNLDLNDQMVDCQQGIYVYNNANHVSIKNGTFNGTFMPYPGAPVTGLRIDPGSSYVSLLNLNFNGTFSYNTDYGSHDSLKNCNFESPLAINVNQDGHGTYENLVVAKNPAVWSAIGNQDYALYSAGYYNSFKNIRVLSGNVQLGGGDTYQHFFYKSPSTVLGGTNLQPGK